MTKKDLTIHVPVICTRGVVAFPNQEMLIEVGRKKSIAAIEESRANYDQHVFVVCQKDISVDDPTVSDVYTVGTLCRIHSVRNRDGALRVTFEGLERARIIDFTDTGELFFAEVEALADIMGNQLEEMALVRRVSKAYEEISNNVQAFSNEVINHLSSGISATELADQFANHFPMPYDHKQMLLEELDVNKRLLKVLREIETEKQLNAIEGSISQKVKERIDENQKEFFLREKMRVIKEELGDVSNKDDDTDSIRKKLETEPYPQAIKEKILEELSRYEMLSVASGEAGVIRTYIDWLIKLPWWQETEDCSSLAEVEAILNADHYGLEKVKERILEYLAVKQMTNSLKAPILCLYGPPGVGKTSLGKSIARALGRKFVKISLGGVKEEAEIRGHRRTYLGSMPGRIIQSMKKAGVMNPVMLIDEIDKMASDYKGDPSSAMLEVLDPEQNKMFSDHYIEEAYDLSKVLFVATANYLENIPPALRDRLELIQLSSYTEEDKIHIARAHLVPKQVHENGLENKQFKISDEVLLYVVRHYTREAGVRQLERVIAKLCRKTVLAILKDGKKSVTVTKKLVNTWLGKEMYDYGAKEKEDQVGVVTGLAYTSFGGDIMPIEVTHFEGKGKLIITGQLGDVMKESCSIALGFVKANASKYGIEPTFFEKNDIHIHVPEGAVPKDGPSAGVTITTAIISMLTDQKVLKDIAMTGEITLRGQVLPIGGLKEKSIAAHRSGIKTICFPKGNVKDLEDVPESVKKDIRYVPCSSIEDVLKEALVK
ncbi:MAG: endopeptidase La [Erysipelotrichales bacterium]|nr:endopeptidase La [Erysipelotrichales bacterium]